MKFVRLFFLLSLTQPAISQNDFLNNIGNSVKDSSSSFYYPSLLNKVKNEPQELTIEDCMNLYYGQVFQKGDYSITLTIPGRMEFDQLAQSGKCKKAVTLGYEILEDNPIELTTLLHTITCMNKNKIPDTEYFLDHRFRKVLDAILSTGDGKTLETAIKLVNLDDDYILKGILGFIGGDEN